MDNSIILNVIAYTIPSIITGIIAFYFFQTYVKAQETQYKYQLLKQNQKDALPIRLQAYERMTLFLERIYLPKLLIRISPFNEDKQDYENYLVQQIEQEFEHNLTQQIYLSADAWTMILTAKNTLIQQIRKVNMNDKIDSPQKLREALINDLMDQESPTALAIAYLKNEVTNFM